MPSQFQWLFNINFHQKDLEFLTFTIRRRVTINFYIFDAFNSIRITFSILFEKLYITLSYNFPHLFLQLLVLLSKFLNTRFHKFFTAQIFIFPTPLFYFKHLRNSSNPLFYSISFTFTKLIWIEESHLIRYKLCHT